MSIVLFTDFGSDGLYPGQVSAVLDRLAPGVRVIDAMNQAPACNPRASAHLLAALALQYPQGSVVVAVVDPGVGGARDPLLLRADGYRFLGPDNGLLSVFAARARHAEWFRIRRAPESMSASFHGRDLFAPLAAAAVLGTLTASDIEPLDSPAVVLGAADLDEVIYIDHYGNAMTGRRAAGVARSAAVSAADRKLKRARVFGEVPEGEAFWYGNSLGLVEIAVNRGSAAAVLGLSIGQRVSLSR